MFAFLLPLALSLWLANWLLRLLAVGAITLLVLSSGGCYMGLRLDNNSMEARPFEHNRTTRIVWRAL